jgi:twitching motility protein PilT
MIEYLNETRPDHIITIEDPIEFVFEPKKAIISQREV